MSASRGVVSWNSYTSQSTSVTTELQHERTPSQASITYWLHSHSLKVCWCRYAVLYACIRDCGGEAGCLDGCSLYDEVAVLLLLLLLSDGSWAALLSCCSNSHACSHKPVIMPVLSEDRRAVMKIRWFASQKATYFRVLANQFDICAHSGANHYTTCIYTETAASYLSACRAAVGLYSCTVAWLHVRNCQHRTDYSVVTLCFQIQNCVAYIIFC